MTTHTQSGTQKDVFSPNRAAIRILARYVFTRKARRLFPDSHNLIGWTQARRLSYFSVEL
jgi:hypothetical protein